MRHAESSASPEPVRTEVQREVDIEATPEEVWEAIATEQGRDRWLEDEPEREIHIETSEAPHHLVWWWAGEDEPATRVAFEIVAVPAGGTRVTVTETSPSPTFPLAMLQTSFQLVAA